MRRVHGFLALGTLAFTCLSMREAHAQTAAMRCRVVDTTRLMSGATLYSDEGDRLVVQPFASVGSNGAAYLVAVRDPSHALHPTAHALDLRSIDELELTEKSSPPKFSGGLSLVRMDSSMRRVGDVIHIVDPVAMVTGSSMDEAGREASDEEATPTGGLPLAVTLEKSVLVVQRIGGDLWALRVPVDGTIPEPVRLTTLTSEHVMWMTATAQNNGAALLAGTDQGRVLSMRFDGDGKPQDVRFWQRKVGGAMELLPTAPDGTGRLVAMLLRPTGGTNAAGLAVYRRVMVPLTNDLQPQNDPDVVPPVETPMPGVDVSYVRNGEAVHALAWDWPRGLVRMDISLTSEGPKVAPLDARAVPTLTGTFSGHDAVMNSAGHLFDVALGVDAYSAGTNAIVTRTSTDGVVLSRAQVLPVRARLVAPPRVIPAADGVVVLLASYDETGAGVDGYHVRCE